MDMKLDKKVGIASAIMIASVFLSRVIGLFREMVIAYVGGVGGQVDAYQVAFIIPDLLNHIVAAGFLSVTFIPIFSRYLVENQENKGWEVVSIILTTFGILLAVGIAICFMLTPKLITMLAPGLNQPDHIALAVRMTRIILPAQFFFFAGGLFMAVQFAKEHFAIPALAPLIYNLSIIAGGLLLGPHLGVEGFSWGVLAGAVVGNFGLQFWSAKKLGMRLYFCFNARHPDLKKYVLLTLPLMVGLTMTFSTEFFLKFFGSFLPEGRIAALNYGFRVTLMLVGFFGQAVGVASFPFMARLVAEDKMDEMNHLLNDTLRYLSVVIPVSVLMIVLRVEIIRILFERGNFDSAATHLTAEALAFMLVGAVAFAAQTVVVRGYYAQQNTLFPALFGTVAVLLSIPAYWAGMKVMGTNGVALAISVSAFFQVVLLLVIWNRRTQNNGSLIVYKAYLKMVLLSVPIAFFLQWFKDTVFPDNWNNEVLGCLLILAAISSIFLCLLALLGYVFKINEIRELMRQVMCRLVRG